MDYSLINAYSIIILVIIFICINIYYKNIINILVLIISFLALRNMMNEQSAILVAYIISLVYGIISNFHLLENFKTYIVDRKVNSNTDLLDIINNKPTNSSNNNSNSSSNPSSSNSSSNSSNNNNKPNNSNSNTSNNNNKPNNSSSNSSSNTSSKKDYAIDSVISEELINQFINKLKQEDNLLIEKTKQNIYDLKPTIKNIKKNKIKKMNNNLNSELIIKPIIVSNDNFIIDGHHRWYLRKNLIENNTNGLNDDSLYDENIDIIKIHYDIKVLVKKLNEYKINYNQSYLSNIVLDINKIKEGNKLIKNIKKDIGALEGIYNVINTRVNLV